MNARTALLLGAALLLPAACKRQDMYTQGYAKTWDRSDFFKNQSTMRHPPEGAVARAVHYPEVPEPTVIDAALLERGHQRFNIFCTPCHGFAGNGRGMIVQRGFPQAPSFVEGKLRTADAKVFYSAITNGYGVMYSYDTRIPPADRWAIISYIRALQRSQNTDPAILPPEDKAHLEASK